MPGFNRPATPPSDDDSQHSDAAEEVIQDNDVSTTEQEIPPTPGRMKRKNTYESRVEKLLYEHSNLQIQITSAGKNMEGGGNYIVYTIRSYVSDTWRATSYEFVTEIVSRTLKCVDGTQISIPCAVLWSVYIQH